MTQTGTQSQQGTQKPQTDDDMEQVSLGSSTAAKDQAAKASQSQDRTDELFDLSAVLLQIPDDELERYEGIVASWNQQDVPLHPVPKTFEGMVQLRHLAYYTAPSGEQYKSVAGFCTFISEKEMPVDIHSHSNQGASWFIKIGTADGMYCTYIPGHDVAGWSQFREKRPTRFSTQVCDLFATRIDQK